MLVFVARLAGGLALAMLTLPVKQVSSGFYRVHLWVLLGLFTFASLLAASRTGQQALWPMIAGATASYLGSVGWLYERPRWGWAILVIVALCAAWGLYELGPRPLGNILEGTGITVDRAVLLHWVNDFSSAILLGVTLCAMLLGHWYLNTPTMQLAPLRRLLLILFGSILMRAAVATLGTWTRSDLPDSGFEWAMFAMHWLAGIIGMALMTLMAWQTLLIPNTQSATGILYVGVILVFLGEMAALIPLG
jgi:hypothetical protein